MCPLLTWTSEWTEIRKWTLITGHGRAIPPALGPTAWQEDTVGNRLGLIKRSGVLGMGWVRSDHGPLSLSSTPRAAQSRGELLAGCLGWAVGPPPALSCDQGCRLAPPSSGPKSKVSIYPLNPLLTPKLDIRAATLGFPFPKLQGQLLPAQRVGHREA